MPTYEYKCNSCNIIIEVTHSIKETPQFFCEKCNSKVPLERIFSLNRTGFILKGGTEAIHWKEKRERIKKRSELGVKQIERYGTAGGTKLRPNVGGVETESWSDAAKLAKEAGINTNSYQPMIEKEKNISKTSGIDDRAWKAAKEQKNNS